MLGIRIALLRTAHNWSQADLARRIGVSTSAVGMYEQSRRAPSLDLVVRLAQELGVTTDYLLTGKSTSANPLTGLQTSATTDRIEALIQILTHTMT